MHVVCKSCEHETVFVLICNLSKQFHVGKSYKTGESTLSCIGNFEENIDLSHIHLAVLYSWYCLNKSNGGAPAWSESIRYLLGPIGRELGSAGVVHWAHAPFYRCIFCTYRRWKCDVPANHRFVRACICLGDRAQERFRWRYLPVSYTHLTLPTKRIV